MFATDSLNFSKKVNGNQNRELWHPRNPGSCIAVIGTVWDPKGRDVDDGKL
jgi:hypothetical protein